MKQFKIKLKETSDVKPKDVVDGYLGNIFGDGKIATYGRGEAIKKARMFGGKIEEVKADISKTTYTVSLTFTDIDTKNPLEAAKKILKWIEDGANSMVYDVIDEITNEKFTVDLSENDEDAVLPNKD